MERRALIAVLVAMGFLLGYHAVIVKLYPPPPAATSPRPAPSSLSATSPAARSAAPAPSHPTLPEQRLQLARPALTIELSSDGGSITHVLLNEHRELTTQQPIALTHPDDPAARLGAVAELRVNGTLRPEPAYDVATQGEALVARATVAPGLRLTKEYQVTDHVLEERLHLTNTTAQPLEVAYTMVIGSPLPFLARNELPKLQGLALAEGKVKSVPLGRAVKQPVELVGPHTVAGEVSRYFALVAAWDQPAERVFFTAEPHAGVRTLARWPSKILAPGETSTVLITWYAGPRDYRQIAAVNRQMAELFPQGLLGTLGTGLLALLRLLSRWTHNYGLAIILLTGVVSAALFPLTWMNLRMSRTAMAQMQFIRPKLERLQEQYKDSPEKLNREMMALYKRHNINPLAQLGGCLPMLLQFPVLIALYNTIGNSLELRGARFLWIHDLSSPDQAFVVAGFPVNALPLCMVGAIFLQQRLSPMKPTTTTPGMPNMMVMMPLLFGIMFYSMPSGLVLYWLTNTILMSVVYLTLRPQPAPA